MRVKPADAIVSHLRILVKLGFVVLDCVPAIACDVDPATTSYETHESDTQSNTSENKRLHPRIDGQDGLVDPALGAQQVVSDCW